MASTCRALASGSAAGPGQSMATFPGASGQNLRRARSKRRARVGHRRKRCVFDRNKFAGILRGRSARSDDHHHRLADVHDPSAGERRPVRHHQAFASASRKRRMAAKAAGRLHVLCRQYADDTGCALRLRRVDACDTGKSVRRAHKIGIGLIREWDVGGVTAASADQNVVLYARLMRRAAIRFCIHALCRNTLLGSGLALYIT